MRWEIESPPWRPCAAALLSATGCGKTTPAFFVLNEVELTHREFTLEQQQHVVRRAVCDVRHARPALSCSRRPASIATKVEAASGPVASDQHGRAARHLSSTMWSLPRHHRRRRRSDRGPA